MPERIENFVSVFMRACQRADTAQLVKSHKHFTLMLAEPQWQSRNIALKDCKVHVERAEMQQIADSLKDVLICRGAWGVTL